MTLIHSEDNYSPTIVLINGTSSTGKSTLARNLQRAWPKAMFYFGLDAWIVNALDDRFWEPATDLTQVKNDEFVRQGTHFLLPHSTENPTAYPIVGSGPVSDHAIFAMHNAAIDLYQQGYSVVLDHVFLKSTWREDFLRKTEKHRCCLVQLICDHAVIELREVRRGDRMPNVFRGLLPIIHQEMNYHMTIDTTHINPEQATEQLLNKLKHQAIF